MHATCHPNQAIMCYVVIVWPGGGLMVSALISGSRGPGSSPGQGHFVVFLSKTLNSQSLSPPRCINGCRQI